MGRWREVSSGEEDNALFHKEERCALTFEGGSIHELQDLTVEQAAFIRCGRDFAQKSGLHLFFFTATSGVPLYPSRLEQVLAAMATILSICF